MSEGSDSVRLAGEEVLPGEKKQVELRLARLPDSTMVSIPTVVMRGIRPGPRLWLSAAVHGDELNGVEVIRRVLELVDSERLRGALFAIPIVNVFGFLHQSRYLPDRRDLNRSFPGSQRGSLASRLADLFMREIVSQCTHGIDLHTASTGRTNLPQIRADLADEETLACAKAFGAPVYLHSKTRDGSLRASAEGRRVLVYEGGEPQRFEQDVIEVGVRGVLQVMDHLGMSKAPKGRAQSSQARVATSRWVRAPHGGLLRLYSGRGAKVKKGEPIAMIAGALGEDAITIKAPFGGVVIGANLNPLVYQGDAVVHLASLESEGS